MILLLNSVFTLAADLFQASFFIDFLLLLFSGFLMCLFLYVIKGRL